MNKDRATKVVNEFLTAKGITDTEIKNTTVDYVFSHYGLKTDQEISDLDIKIMANRYLSIQATMPEGEQYKFSKELF